MTNRAMPNHRTRTALLSLVVAAGALVVGSCVPAAAPAPLGKRPAPNGPAEREIVFPVGVEVSFSDTFGDPRGGGTRTHQGQDLMAPKMTPLVATTDGHVSWMRWGNAGNSGNMLILTDSDGWEYTYVHINNDSRNTDDGKNTYEIAFVDGIKRGQQVKEGEIIAWVGDSGNAENSGPHLHFEMRDPHGVVVNGFNSLAHARLYVRGPADHASDAAFGNVDSVVRSGTGLGMTGWGLDRHEDDPIEVSVYVDGNPVDTDDADVSRPDVEAAHPGRGDHHGFEFTGVPAAAGSEVCVVLHSTGGGGNVRLPCTVAPS